MKKGMMILIVIAVIILGIGSFGVSTYNNLVQENENVQMAMSQIDNQLQRRNDLIPNLVETVKGFAAQEKSVFLGVSEARAKLAGSATLADKAAASGELSGALSRLLAISEAYPELKSDANFRQLSDELAGTENRIATARNNYNEIANSFNKKVRTFPTSLIAGMLGFEKVEYFEAEAGAKDAPKVNFNTTGN